MTGDQAAEEFWRFSLMVYSRPGVADALIALQDRGGHNINLILFGLWLGLCEATGIDATGLARAKAAIEAIDRDIVAPLRQLRRRLKADPDPDMQSLRRRVLTLEIAAERRVQARLAASVTRGNRRRGNRQALAEANLRLILGADFESEQATLVLKSVAAP